jgi:hypothetical protein
MSARIRMLYIFGQIPAYSNWISIYVYFLNGDFPNLKDIDKNQPGVKRVSVRSLFSTFLFKFFQLIF